MSATATMERKLRELRSVREQRDLNKAFEEGRRWGLAQGFVSGMIVMTVFVIAATLLA